MTTKAIFTLAEKAIAIEDAAKLNQGAVTVALAEKFPTPVVVPPDGEAPASLTEPVPVPDWQGLQDFIARELERGRERLIEAGNAYEREIQEDPRQREERESVVAEAYQQLVTVRQVLEAAIGEAETLEILGVEGSTPQRPANLLERMREASVRLRRPGRLPTDLRMPGMTQSWGDLADALDRQADELGRVLELQRAERRNAALALVAKDRAQTSFNNTYVGFTRVLDGLYIAADERELAGRLRLTLPAANAGGDDGSAEEPLPDIEPPDTFPPGPPPGRPDGEGDDEQVLTVAAVDRDGDAVRPIVALPPEEESRDDS